MPVAEKDTNQEDKLWQNSWSLEQMNENAENWNLAADAGLLNYLQDFASRLTTKAHECSQNVNQLVHRTRIADASVKIVTNQFLSLSNSQFIENRVYDEDVTNHTDKDKQNEEENATPKTREEREKEIIPKIKQAVELGLKVLEDAYDVLDVEAGNSDFDSDDSDYEEQNGGTLQGIYEPKDPYVHRPLPHLIGSRGFHETDDLGLGDVESETEETQDDIISSSEESDVEIGDKKDNLSLSSDYSSDISLSDSEDEDQRPKKNEQKPEEMSENSSSGSEGGLFEDEKNSDKFSSTESEEEEVVTKKKLVKKSKTVPKQQKQEPADLFGDDDSDEDDMMNANGGGLFGAGSNLFASSNKKRKRKVVSDLFDDADISEEELSKSSENDEVDNTSQVISEDEDNLHKSSRASSAVSVSKSKDTPFGGVSLFGGAISKNFFNKAEDDENESDSDAKFTKTDPPKQTSSLFDSESDNDLFTPASKNKSSPKHMKKVFKQPEVQTKSSKGLFDSDSDDDLFAAAAPKTKSQKKLSVISSPSHSDKSIVNKSNPDLFPNNYPENDDSIESKKSKKSSSLFDSDSDDMFAAPDKKTDTNVKPTKKLTMFDDSDSSENDLFSSKPAKNTSQTTTKAASKTPPKITTKEKNIFDSDSSDNIVNDIKVKSDQKNLATVEKSNDNKPAKDLFDTDSESDQEKPEVDNNEQDEELFSVTPKEKAPMAGAVPMFVGSLKGSKLANAISKRRADTEESDVVIEDVEEPVKNKDTQRGDFKKDLYLNNSMPKPFLPTTSNNSTNKTTETSKQVDKSEPDSPKPKAATNIKSIGNKLNLNIDPTHLLPGAAPKPRPVEKVEASFDNPPKMKTLESVTKTRAKGQTRRPPSRRGRGKATPASDDVTGASNATSTVEDKKPTNEIKQLKVDARLPSDITDTPNTDKATENKPSTNFGDSEDLFSNSVAKKKVPEVKMYDNDLFADNTDLFSSVKSKSKTKSKNPDKFDIFDDDDTDIFGDLNLKSNTNPKSTKTKERVDIFKNDDDIFADDDDLFKSEMTTAPTKPTASDIFDDTSDDIFEHVPKKSQQRPKKNKDLDNIFDDDLDDIFLTSSKKTTPSKSKKADDKPGSTRSNIFDDPLNAFQ